MKLIQLHNTTLVVCEDTETSLKVTLYSVFKKRRHEVLYEDLLIKDLYEVDYHDQSLLSYVNFFAVLFGISATYVFVSQHRSWTVPIIFAVPALWFTILFFIKRKKICIPTKAQGLIRLYHKQPNKKSVDGFIYILEGKVNLVSRKRPEKINLKDFIIE